MIADLILNVIYGVLWAIVQLIANLSDVQPIPGLSSAVVKASQLYTSVNSFLPISELIGVFLGVVVIYAGAYFTFKLIYWIIKRIPTQS